MMEVSTISLLVSITFSCASSLILESLCVEMCIKIYWIAFITVVLFIAMFIVSALWRRKNKNEDELELIKLIMQESVMVILSVGGSALEFTIITSSNSFIFIIFTSAILLLIVTAYIMHCICNIRILLKRD